jgi:hypothetical protein
VPTHSGGVHVHLFHNKNQRTSTKLVFDLLKFYQERTPVQHIKVHQLFVVFKKENRTRKLKKSEVIRVGERESASERVFL